MMDLVREFRAVRAVGTPIVAVKTQNQPDTIRGLSEPSVKANCPVLRWDAVRGLTGLNGPGQDGLALVLKGGDQSMTVDVTTALEVAASLPPASLLFVVNAHRFIDDPRVTTAVGNLRDIYKGSGSTCVLLGPAFTLPAEVLPDVVRLDDPLPDDAGLANIVDFVFEQAAANAGADAIEAPTESTKSAAVAALRGLSSFGAEQQAFLSLRKNGSGKMSLDMKSLWARKIEAINAIPGLTMDYSDKSGSDAVCGLEALRQMLDRLFSADNPERPGACLHIDEIDKALAGFGRSGPGDSSGVTQDQVGQILQYMEERGWDGIIPVGVPGSGKTLVSKTAASLYGVPYLRLDLGALKGSLVGVSEERVRAALETTDRIGAGRIFVFATCNRLDSLPPELRRRFTAGIWYFDLPSAEEREQIWAMYMTKYSIVEMVPLWSDGWTGAEIRNACRTAYRLKCSLEEAKTFIVPMCESGREDIERLRQAATGRFLDASRGGPYRFASESVAPTTPKRKLEV